MPGEGFGTLKNPHGGFVYEFEFAEGRDTPMIRFFPVLGVSDEDDLDEGDGIWRSAAGPASLRFASGTGHGGLL